MLRFAANCEKSTRFPLSRSMVVTRSLDCLVFHLQNLSCSGCVYWCLNSLRVHSLLDEPLMFPWPSSHHLYMWHGSRAALELDEHGMNQSQLKNCYKMINEWGNCYSIWGSGWSRRSYNFVSLEMMLISIRFLASFCNPSSILKYSRATTMICGLKPGP